MTTDEAPTTTPTTTPTATPAGEDASVVGDTLAGGSDTRTGASASGRGGRPNTPPVVALIMGSDSDWRVMSGAAEVLDDLGVGYEVGVYSAHRTPQRMLDYASHAAERGLRVIIAGAGGAAHLPGMVASATVLPVIGVPVKLAALDGLDSLLSIVQMPAGIPVATVSVDGARNAGLLAARILATAPDPAGRALAGELRAYADDLAAQVLAKHDVLRGRTGR